MNKLMMLMSMGLLLAPEGEESGAGGTGGESTPNPNPGAAPSSSPAGTSSATAGQNTPSAPVTREEFQALNAKLDKLLESKAPSAGQNTPAPAPASGKPPDAMPEWAREMSAKMDAFTAETAKRDAADRRRDVVSKILSEVPDANRGLAELAVDGLLSKQAINFGDKALDVDAVAKQLGQALRTQYGEQLFQLPGSPFKAVPKTSDGKPDFSSFTSLAEVPENYVQHIPDDDYRRLTAGASAGSRPHEIRPYNNFNRKN